jgi:Spy/CpxP family protein refolding chaperone
MKNTSGYNTKDNVVTAIVIAAMAALTISALVAAPANAEATMPVIKMEPIIVTAQREHVVKLDTIVVTASRSATV